MKKPVKGTDTLSQRIKELRDAYDKLQNKEEAIRSGKLKKIPPPPDKKESPDKNSDEDPSASFAVA